MTDRNPDIDVDRDPTPPGCYVHKGVKLQKVARAAKVPFGVATWLKRYTSPMGKPAHTRMAVGLVIREEDRERFTAAADKALARRG